MANHVNPADEENEQNPNLIEDKSNTSIDIPAVEVFSLATYGQRYQLNSQAFSALIKEDPQVLIQLIQENQRQQGKSDEQEFELAKKRLDQEHQRKLQEQENKFKAEQQSKNIIRLGVAAFCGIFVASLIYASRVDDKNLPNTIITAAISLLAGGSTSVIAFSKREDRDEENDKTQKK